MKEGLLLLAPSPARIGKEHLTTTILACKSMLATAETGNGSSAMKVRLSCSAFLGLVEIRLTSDFAITTRRTVFTVGG